MDPFSEAFLSRVRAIPVMIFCQSHPWWQFRFQWQLHTGEDSEAISHRILLRNPFPGDAGTQ